MSPSVHPATQSDSSTARQIIKGVNQVNDVSSPARASRARHYEAGNGSAEAVHGVGRLNQDPFTPIFNALYDSHLLSEPYELSTASRTPPDRAAISIEEITSFAPEPFTAPIPIQTAIRHEMPVPSRFGRSIEPSPQPRSGPPMSALARERAAVEAMLAALRSVPVPPQRGPLPLPQQGPLRLPQQANRRAAARPMIANRPEAVRRPAGHLSHN